MEKAEEWERGRKKIQNRMSNDVDKEGTLEDHLVVLLQEAVQTSCEDGGADPAQNVDSMGKLLFLSSCSMYSTDSYLL